MTFCPFNYSVIGLIAYLCHTENLLQSFERKGSTFIRQRMSLQIYTSRVIARGECHALALLQ